MNLKTIIYLIIIFIGLLITSEIRSGLGLDIGKRIDYRKRYKDIKEITQISDEEYKKLKEKNKKETRVKVFLGVFGIIFISLISFIINLITINNVLSIIIAVILPIACGVGIATVVISDYYKSIWYYNLDEYLFERYQLTECLNKREEIKKLKNQVDILKTQKKSSKKFIPDEEFAIGNLRKQISELENKNGYKDSNGNYFEFKIVSKKIRRTPVTTYKIYCKFIINENELKSKEELDKIIKKYSHLSITYNSKEISTEFVKPFYEMNYKSLANLVTYSYQACKEFLKQ